MFKHIIVHLGLHKTGTTSIQRTLFVNYDALLNFGIAYPKFEVDRFKPANQSWPIINLVSNNPSGYHLNIRNQIDNKIISLSNMHNIATLREMSEKCDTLLISAEGISNLDANHLQRFKTVIESNSDKRATFEFHYFKRKVDNYITSVVQERLKGGTLEHHIFEGLSASDMSNDYLRIDALKRIFPQSKITEHSFEKACKYRRGLEHYFLEKVVGYKHSFKAVKISNESLSAQSYELIQNYISSSSLYQDVPLSGSEYQKNIHLLSLINGDKFKLNLRHIGYIKAFENKKHILKEKELLREALPAEYCWKRLDFKSTCKHLIIVSDECRNISLDYLRCLARETIRTYPKTTVQLILLIITVKFGVPLRSIIKAIRVKASKKGKYDKGQ
ncbi:hypothetical protein L4C42_09315 [Vibrio wakamikoensis]|uniref:Sulfotransferase domain-containing protein n=1 Tax=Vibrio chaetopteri TaxID=3016528 RepID=A0AAU8BKX7_9VIBR